MTIPTELFIFVVILATLSGLLVGWDLAVHHGRRNRRILEASVGDLEAQVASFREDMDVDPQRAWINLGKRNILNQMDNALRTIRATMGPEA